MPDFVEPLAGLKVLEIAEGCAGPICAMQLADLGADVIKVEPHEGDRARDWGPRLPNGQSAIFAQLNRGKRSVMLDIRSPEDRDRVKALVSEADVVLVHLDPADREALGWCWRSIQEDRPELIVCELTDFGGRGPLADRAGSELTVQALSGFTRYAGKPDAPARVGYEIAGVGAAMHAASAIMAMVLRRKISGLGDYCEISLLGQLLSLKQILLAAQSDPDAWEGFHLNGPFWPSDHGWETSDGQITFDFRAGRRDQWTAFCEKVGLTSLIDDPEYEDWRSTIYIGDRKDSHGHVYRPILKAMTSDEANDLINGLGGISVKFQDFEELLAHPQIGHLDPFVDVPDAPEGARKQVGTPFHFAGACVSDPCPAPAPDPATATPAFDRAREASR